MKQIINVGTSGQSVTLIHVYSLYISIHLTRILFYLGPLGVPLFITLCPIVTE